MLNPLPHASLLRYVKYNYYVFVDTYTGAVSRSTLVIGYYHGLLLRDIDADLVTDKMRFAELLTIDEQSIISSGHSVHHRNWLLLEHVQCMSPEFVLQFSDIIQEEWSKIGSQLKTGVYLCYNTYILMYVRTVLSQSMWPCCVIIYLQHLLLDTSCVVYNL